MSSNPKITYEQLIAFAAGELADHEAGAVESRLARDPDAARTVARYRQMQATIQADDGRDPPPETVARAQAIFEASTEAGRPGLLEHVERLVARLIFDSRAQPVPVGLRGPATGFQLTYELLEARLELHAEPAEESGDDPSWRLVGQITSPTALPPVPVSLYRAGEDRLVQAARTDERGVFLLRAESGSYDLHLDLPQRTAVVPDIRIA